jgi:uncharacterized protein with GYD domain
MPTYIALFKWTDQGVRDVKDTVTRNEQGRAMVERAGGRMIGFWWTQSAYDGVAVVEVPDDETASALSLTLSRQGHVRSETLRAYTAEEMQRILQKLP